MKRLFPIVLAFAALFGAVAPATAQTYDSAPWLADLEQVRRAFQDKYANRDWLEGERELKLEPLLDRVATQLRQARSDAEARASFDRLARRTGDGHVEFIWPEPPRPASAKPGPAPAPAPDFCAGLGYDARQSRPGTAHALPGFTALRLPEGSPFEAGTVQSGQTKVGILRIGVFQPHGFPELCRAAVRVLRVPVEQPCDEQCQDRILTWAYDRLTASLEERLRQLKAIGATVLLVDITGNGGGSEWAEAAARTLSARQLVSGRRGFVRGEHWAKQWRNLAAQLREAAAKAAPNDKKRLLAWAAESDSAAREADTPCPVSNGCSRIAKAGFSIGLVGSARSGSFAGKDWAPLVFNPAQFNYHDGVWDGAVIVLVDQETWSAAEQFAALLQDNRAAIVLGARTGGAGCGHTYGGTPTKLANSGAVLKLPDCVRFRADGSNEVRGILPDELVAIRADDGVRFRARLIAERLPAAIARAQGLSRP